jgi:parvulin-like peptidyl-prolyl isomerase
MPLSVNSEVIERALIEQEAHALGRRFQEMPAEQRQAQGLDIERFQLKLWEWSQENLIERTLLRQEALKDQSPVPAEQVEAALEQFHKQRGEKEEPLSPEAEAKLREEVETRLRIERLLESLAANVSPPKPKDIAEFYRKHRDHFKTPERVHAAHIVKHVNETTDEATARAAIEKAEAELRNGANFEELANRDSDCPGNRGDLGQFPRGHMVEAFENVVFEMEPGQVSPIFRTEFGFHIAKLYEKVAAGYRPLGGVQEEIKAQLLRQKHARAVESLIDRARAKADVQGFQRAAPANGVRVS